MPIENENQYNITLDWIQRFSEVLEHTRKVPQADQSILMRAGIEAAESILDELKRSVQDYLEKNKTTPPNN